jgi:hypothetical protein
MDAAVRLLLERMSQTLTKDHTTPIRWIVVSPLAKGADRIIAHAALEVVQARLDVITPFSLVEYRRDFVEHEDAAEFEDLFGRCKNLTILSQPDPKSSELPTITDGLESLTKEQRHRGYLQVGQAVVDAVEILIVIWDGKSAAGLGGTGDIIPYALARGRIIVRLDPNDPAAGPVLVRLGSEKVALEKEWTFAPLPDTALGLSTGYVELDKYCRDDAIGESEISRNSEATRRWLYGIASRHGLSEGLFERVVKYVLPQYSRADLLANYYHKLYTRANVGLFALTTFAVTAATAQKLFPAPFALWIVAELAALMVALAWLRRSRHKNWHRKWLESRYIAEHLRTAMFTVLRQLNDQSFKTEAPSSLRYYTGPGHWLSDYCGRIIRDACQQQPPRESQEQIQNFICEAWIEEQLHWHRKNAKRRAVENFRIHRAGQLFFVATLILGFLHLLGVGHHGNVIGTYLDLDDWMTFFAIVLPAWGAAIHAINNQLETGRMVARSRGMVEALSEARDKLRSAQTSTARWKIILETERLAHHEQYEWWVLLSFREMPLPT